MSTSSDAQRPEAASLLGVLLRRTIHAILAPSLLGAGLIGSSAYAQQAPASDEEQLKEIVVTGSLIKRTDIETPSPVQVISAEQIRNSGYTNVSDLLRTLPSSGQGSLSQSFNQAFAVGAQGVALRGLTVGETLVLIDGVREVQYPIEDDNERTFSDISAIPINAIDRIEVLKDGASALYGADAIAGVVNIILKKNYQGGEITAEAGTSQHKDGTTEHLSALYGFGDVDSDGYNFYVALDFHHTDVILASSRAGEGFTNTNWSSLPYGLNATPGSAASPIVAFPNSTTGYLLNPASIASGNNIGPQNATFLPGCTYALQEANKCEYTYPGQLQPPTEQTNLIAKFTKSLAGGWSLGITGSVFDSIAEQVYGYQNAGPPGGDITEYAYGPGTTVTPVLTPAITVPATYPGNPYGTAAPLVYSFPAATQTQIETTTYRLVADTKGQVAGWDIGADIGLMYAKATEKESGYINWTDYQNAFNDGSYVIGQTSINQGLNLFAPVITVSPSSSLDVIDLNASRALFQLPGGPLSMAAGFQFFHRAENDVQPGYVEAGLTGANAAFDVGASDDTAGFLEFNARPLKSIELDAAIRYDHYNTIGGGTSPKLALKYQPISQFLIRGTWGKGFRAPSSAEGQGSGTAFGAGTLQDPVLCANGINTKGSFNYACEYPLVGFETNGTNLKPVVSTNATFGVVFEPIPQFSTSVDYYEIRLNNDIIPTFEIGGLGAYTSLARGAPELLAVCTNTVTTGTCAQQTVETPVGVIADAIYPYINASQTKTEGLDVDMRANFDAGAVGKFNFDLNYTRIFVYDITAGGSTYILAGTHGPTGVSGDTGNPRDRATASVTWTNYGASVTLTEIYVGEFDITDPSSGIDTCIEGLNESEATYAPRFNGVTQASVPSQYCNVKSFFETNLYANYAVNDHLFVHGSITNLWNAQPPIDLQTYGGGGFESYDGAFEQDGAVGRFYTLGATYKF